MTYCPALSVRSGWPKPSGSGRQTMPTSHSFCGPDGRRLAKRHGDTRLSTLREQGVSAEKVVRWAAETSGLPWGRRSRRAAKKPKKSLNLVQYPTQTDYPEGPVVRAGALGSIFPAESEAQIKIAFEASAFASFVKFRKSRYRRRGWKRVKH